MRLSLPIAAGKYDAGNEAQTRKAIEQADAMNLKSDQAAKKLLMRDTVTGAVRTLTIANGVVTVT